MRGEKINMKYILVILDGIGDHPAEELGGKTPLEASKIPNLNFFAKSGKVGSVSFIPERMEPNSSLAAVSLFGHHPKDYPIGLGPLEAANLEIKLEENEVAFRMNFVTESQGALADDTAGNISTKEAKALVMLLNKQLSSGFVKFFPGTHYKHIAVIKDAEGLGGLSAKCTPPEQVIGKKIEEHLPGGTGSELIRKLMYDTKLLLAEHEVNQVRLDLGENPANMIWLWAQGIKPKIPRFSERFMGLTGAMISVDDHMKGLGRLLGLTVMDFQSEEELDYEAMFKTALEVLKEKDFVCIHISSCDEASREGNLKKKIHALEMADFHIAGGLKNYYEGQKETRIMIAPLLTRLWKTKSAMRDAVPFLTAGKNVVADEIEKFSEAASKLSNLKFRDGHKLMDYFLSVKE